MAFDFHQYNQQYLANAQAGKPLINDAAAYGVEYVPVHVPPGQTYWRIIGIHHLRPEENQGKHNVFFEALNEQGQRVSNPHSWAGWTWEGRKPNERADPVPLDKPSYETAGNIAVHYNQTVSTWIKGLNPGANDLTDAVKNLHTRHADEPSPGGGLGNTLGHHSFYLVFQRTINSAALNDGIIQGQVINGVGYTLQLRQDNFVVDSRVIGPELTYRFSDLEYGSYALAVVDTTVGQNNIVVSQANKIITINLVVPAPAQSVIFGRVTNGAGKTLQLLSNGSVINSRILPSSTEYRFESLAAGLYSLLVVGSTTRQDNIALDGSNSRHINLEVTDDGSASADKAIDYYILYGPAGSTGRQTNLLLATNYILAFSATVGYSVAEAMRAAKVTIIGDGISPQDITVITESGAIVEVLAGDAYAIEAELNRRIREGTAFPHEA